VRIPKIICLALYLITCNVSAQSDNFWNLINKGAITFKSGDPVFTSQNGFGYHSGSLCNSKGELLIYTDAFQIFDNQHNVIENGTLFSMKDSALCPSPFSSLFLNFGDTLIYLIQANHIRSKKDCFSKEGLTYTVIHRKSSGAFYVDLTKKLILFKESNPSSTLSSYFSACRNQDGTFFIQVIHSDSLFIFSCTPEPTLNFQMSLDGYRTFNPTLLPDSLYTSTTFSSIFDHSGNHLYLTITDGVGIDRLLKLRIGFALASSAKIVRFDFDKSFGTLNNPKIIYERSGSFKNILSPQIGDSCVGESLNINQYAPVISLNDNHLYLFSRGFKSFLLPTGPKTENGHPSIIQVNLTNGVAMYIADQNSVSEEYLKQSPDGRILHWNLQSISGKYNCVINTIEFPNNSGTACGYKKDAYTLPLPTGVNGGAVQFHLFDFIRLDYRVNYDCKANVQFVNNSFSEMAFSDYTWYINRPNGKTDTLIGATPFITYESNGKYPYKVFGHSTSKKYGEWFYDTLRINIPEKPIANFKAVDTIVCRYLPLQFRNMSYAYEINPNKKPEYLWHFGDGQTSSDYEPTHVYTQPGTYTVSLFYSNGYCDSTLVKNQYIKVTDAPKPGFSIDNNRGCTPFTVNFTDTSVLNVTKKEYYFSDVDQWQLINTPKFSHTFNQPGVFRAVQRLYGYTGCIIQTDSVFVYVTPGLTISDTVHVLNSSYLDNNRIEVQWQPLSAAVKYSVFKDGTFLSETDKTDFVDPIKLPSLMVYSAKGIDSCGTQSSSGRIGKPVLLSGAVSGNNEFSVLSFTPYQQWDDPEIEYTIEHFLPSTQTSLAIVNPADSFTDKAFLQEGQLEKCYRVSAKGLNNALVSHSNILCLPYIPVIYVPNSFTPNQDGVNDVFKPQVFGIEEYTFQIYNRWGQIIHDSDVNGLWKADDIDPGIYMYQITLITPTGVSYYKNGTVHLLK
jgi:gliding motility-associated-like protein